MKQRKTSCELLYCAHEVKHKNVPNLIEESHKIIMSQQQEITAQNTRYIQLLEEIKLLKIRHFAPSPEKNILQPDMFDEAGVILPDEVKAQLRDKDIEVKYYTRKQHPVRRALPAYLPREVVIHDLTATDKICSCGEHLVSIGEEVSEQLKYIPAQVSVVQHVRPKYGCKPCQDNVRIAAMPTLLLPKSIATPELVAHVILSKYCDHLRLYRQEEMWSR